MTKKYIDADDFRDFCIMQLDNRIFAKPKGKYYKGYKDGEIEMLGKVIEYLDSVYKVKVNE